MKRRKPPTAPREDYTLVEFTSSQIAPMRDLIVCCTPDSTVLRARLLDRFAQFGWNRKALAVDLVTSKPGAAWLEIRANGSFVATGAATALEVQQPASQGCPRCQSRVTTYELINGTRHPRSLATVMTACRRCGWRSSQAEYDLGRTA